MCTLDDPKPTEENEVKMVRILINQYVLIVHDFRVLVFAASTLVSFYKIHFI